MARPESVALGGYYPTPEHLIDAIAELLDVSAFRSLDARYRYPFGLVDPCAGEGTAVLKLRDRLAPAHGGVEGKVYACELEGERVWQLQRGAKRGPMGWGGDQIVHGDAFCVEFGTTAGAHVLYLNPPYDHDPEFGRLEQRFLDRFTAVLGPGAGVLVFVVPRYALSASAAHLATHYEAVECVRFPDRDYEAFQQVVLVGRRRAQPAPFGDRALQARIEAWAVGAELPLLRRGCGVRIAVGLTTSHTILDRWELAPFDLQGTIEAQRAWMVGSGAKLRPVRGLGLEHDVADLLRVRFATIMPPRAAHVAVALASGLVNGFDVQPDDADSGLPAIMVKGTFAREYRTVEEKKNKDGQTTALIQVQQPKLRVTVLDMASWCYHDLKDGAEPTGSRDFAEMNVADLLQHYGRGLAQLMHRQCPPLFDSANPAHEIELPELGLRPFRAQAHCITAGLRALFSEDAEHEGENLFVLGEVGTGKTLVTLALIECLTAKRIGGIRAQLGGRRVRPVRRVLVVCPPHLLTTWEAEVGRVLPSARVAVLATVGDVEAARTIEAVADDAPGAGLVVLLLSREMAKLGHSWESGVVRHRCPRCGGPVDPEADPVRRRLRCDHVAMHAADRWARLAVELAELMASAGVSDGTVDPLVRGRVLRTQLERMAERPHDEARPSQDAEWLLRAAPASAHLDATPFARILRGVQAAVLEAAQAGDFVGAERALKRLALCAMVVDHPERDAWILRTVRELYLLSWELSPKEFSSGHSFRKRLRTEVLPLVKDVGGAGQQVLTAELRELDGKEWGTIGDLDHLIEQQLTERSDPDQAKNHSQIHAHNGTIAIGNSWDQGRWIRLGSATAARRLLEALVSDGHFEAGSPCGEPLYQAVPRPRRYPLATYIATHARDLFDLLVVDEAHEYSHDGSAQERAVHRLTELGKPVVMLTGTSNNGYASSLFANTWAVSRRFRREFARGDLMPFVNRYGYRKVKVEPADKSHTIPANYGAVTDRVDSTGLVTRAIGEAPGVLPLYILKHLLPGALVIHKDDLDIDLPPMVEIPTAVDLPGSELRGQYLAMRQRLMEQIKKDLFTERAGKLWGQMAQLPSYLDRAHSDTGNTGDEGDRRYEIRYPESVGGELVATAFPLPASELTPKEEWLLETVQAEIDSGRPVMVFVWNTNSGLAARIERLVADAIGNHVVTLDAQKVQAGKRQAWIDTHVVKKKRRVLIVNPKAVETGLNNLTYFPTVVWQQNPNCSPIIYSQANGRVHRPGQTADEVRVYVPYYAATSQEVQFTLLGHKVQASRQTDGLDITTALAAAGVGGNDSHIDAMTIGRAIYEMLTTAKPRSAPARRPAVATSQLDMWGAA